jgi:Ulp1 family protease
LEKLHQIVHDNYVISNKNDALQEIAVYVHPTRPLYRITYEDFQKYREGKFAGCKVVNGYMHLLEETYNNDEKNKFFAHQFFPTVLESAWDAEQKKKGTPFEKLVQSDEFKKDWAKWEKLHFPMHKNDHWFLIVADKAKKEILIYDSLAHANKYHFEVTLKLINKRKKRNEQWTVNTQQHLDIQQQKDGVNCGYITCWYAHQIATDQSVTCWPKEYHKELKEMRENIMCSLIQKCIVTEMNKNKIWDGN